MTMLKSMKTHVHGRTIKLSYGAILVVSAVAFVQSPIARAQSGVDTSPSPLPVQTINHDAPSVGRTLKYNLVLPENYETSDRRYPVLYLLHGYSQDYTAWHRLGAPWHARGRGLIVVMPDAGNSFYVNWAVSNDGGKHNWEDYFIKDLIPHVDANYRTLASRNGRAINGLSMGGYGALVLGLRNPELFISIGSHSGALGFARRLCKELEDNGQASYGSDRSRLSTEPRERIDMEDFDSQLERMPDAQMFTTTEDCEAHDPFKLVLEVPREKLPHIYVDCGTEDGLFGSSNEFARLLLEHKIPLTYAQSPGAHRGAYWAREIGPSMAVQAEVMRRSRTRIVERAAQ